MHCVSWRRKLAPSVSNDLTPEAIRALRARLGLTQPQFAARIGCDAITVSRWENGWRRPQGLYARELRRLMDETEESQR